MIAFIRRALDANRLAKELEIAECEIKSLKAELSSKLIGPMYVEVKRSFDVSNISDRVVEQAIHDLSPMVEERMIYVMKQVASSLQRDNVYRMSVDVAYDMSSNLYEYIFEMPKMGTRIRAIL